MRKLVFILLCLPAILSAQQTRNPLLWPFADTSIWNMPIGSNAQYLPAQIERAMAYGMTVDEDLIVLRKQANLIPIMTNYAGWDRTKDRCLVEGPLLFDAPIPPDFIVSPTTWDGLTPNSGLAVLMPDGQTIKQTQPFSQCTAGQATSQFVPPDVNLLGDGIRGAHGGSGLSAIGGTIRLGELDDPGDTIRHVLKVNLFGARNLYYDTITNGYRWPAIRADSYAPGSYGTERIGPPVIECRMGALLALPIWLDLDSMAFETVPARILAQAFQKYGAYIVDDTNWDVYAIETEWSPDGRVIDEFETAWGFSMSEASKQTPWTRDMDRIFLNLHIVDNNAPGSRGGGGQPCMPLAPPFETTTSLRSHHQDRTWSIYPNPGQVQIRVEGEQVIKRLKVYDSRGRLRRTLVPNALLWELDVRQWPKGIYFLCIHTAEGIDTKKLLLE
ncbi:MAG: T9SS type A sorting domain-containing protein [Bacteroidota bacterium]